MKKTINKGTRLVSGKEEIMVVERLGDLVWVRDVFSPNEKHPEKEGYGPVQCADDLDDLLTFGWTVKK